MVRRLITMTALAAVLTTGALPMASAAVLDPSVGAAAQSSMPIEKAGCVRWGLTGYHWYNFCVGPSWLYPHHCNWHHGIKICH